MKECFIHHVSWTKSVSGRPLHLTNLLQLTWRISLFSFSVKWENMFLFFAKQSISFIVKLKYTNQWFNGWNPRRAAFIATFN